MIFRGSRYQNVGTYQAVDSNGRSTSALKIRLIPSTPAGFIHSFTAGERLDLIAYKYYRNPEKFWLIADANDRMDPDDLAEPGNRLLIPPDRT